MNSIVFILNYAPHYRTAIFKRLNDGLPVDFYFGHINSNGIKKLNYSELSNFKGEFKTVRVGSLFWYVGSWRLVFKQYKNYVLIGDPHIISVWFILFLSKLTGKQTFLWTHGWYKKERGIKNQIKKIFYGLADHIFLYGEHARTLMISEGFSQNKLTIINNSLDYDMQLKLRHSKLKSDIYKEHFGNDNPVLIFIGRITRLKRIDLLFKALYILKSGGMSLNLVLVGDVMVDNNFEIESKNYDLSESIWFYGASYDETVNAELLFNADLCVSPGNVGLTAIHSLMYGTPVLSHNNFSKQMPEYEAILEGHNGGFFEENNAQDLARKINELLALQIKKEDCYEIVDKKWNPANQFRKFKSILISNES